MKNDRDAVVHVFYCISRGVERRIYIVFRTGKVHTPLRDEYMRLDANGMHAMYYAYTEALASDEFE